MAPDSAAGSGWLPQAGSQLIFLRCPFFECLYHGSRGPGKTDALIMDFAQDVGRGHGPAWRGVLFRQSHPQLEEVRAKTKRWFPTLFPGARWNESRSKWVFSGGEELLLRHMAGPEDCRFRYRFTDSTLGDFTAVFTETVTGKSNPPPDLANLFFENGRLLWDYPNPPPDLAGFRVKSHAGDNRAWASAPDVNPAGLISAPPFDISKFGDGTRTFMVKAVDTSGNESINAAVVVLALGDLVVDNVVLTTSYDPTFPGTIVGGTVNGGVLEADATGNHWLGDDANVLWRGEDENPVWSPQFDRMTYQMLYTPPGEARLSLDLSLEALDGHGIEVAEALVSPLWEGVNANPIWSGVDSNPWWSGAPGAFFAWPGELALLRKEYVIKLTTFQGSRQANLSAMAAVLDVPDMLEEVDDVAIAAIGTRLALTKTFTAITSVQVTFQDDGGLARRLEVKDKDPVLGPLIQARTSAGALTTATIDAQVQGYIFDTA